MLRSNFMLAMFLVLASHSAFAASAQPILVETPRGGEVYAPGQQQTVVLNDKTAARRLLVELSRDGGSSFETLGVIDNLKKKRNQRIQFKWTVANPATTNAVIRVTSTDESYPGSATSNSFAIAVISVDSIASDSRYVLKVGDSMSGSLTLSGEPEAALHATTKQYVDALAATKVGKSGDAMSGALTLSGDPAAALHAATKQYVDQKAGAAAGVAASAGNSVVTALNDAATTTMIAGGRIADSAVTSAKIEDGTILAADLSAAVDGRFVKTAGDTLTGALTLSGDPTAVLHAATKQYVDQQAGAASGVAAGAGNSVVTALNDAATTGTISASKLTDASVATGKIADDAVTAPKLAAFPKAYAYKSALIPLANGVDTVLSMDAEKFDTDNCHDNVTNPTRLTCNTSGAYFVSAYVAFESNSTGFRHVFVRVNGGTAISSDVRTSYNSSDLTVSTLYQLNAGDYVEVFASQNSGAALNINLRGFMMARLP
jgi:hypothetical protein